MNFHESLNGLLTMDFQIFDLADKSAMVINYVKCKYKIYIKNSLKNGVYFHIVLSNWYWKECKSFASVEIFNRKIFKKVCQGNGCQVPLF